MVGWVDRAERYVLWKLGPVFGFCFGQRKGRNEVTQVKRFSLAMLLMASALVATAALAVAHSDPRSLLGLGILELTVIIAFLMAWYLPIGSHGDGPRRGVSRFLRKTRRRRVNRSHNP
jgi:hypothetical protein